MTAGGQPAAAPRNARRVWRSAVRSRHRATGGGALAAVRRGSCAPLGACSTGEEPPESGAALVLRGVVGRGCGSEERRASRRAPRRLSGKVSGKVLRRRRRAGSVCPAGPAARRGRRSECGSRCGSSAVACQCVTTGPFQAASALSLILSEASASGRSPGPSGEPGAVGGSAAIPAAPSALPASAAGDPTATPVASRKCVCVLSSLSEESSGRAMHRPRVPSPRAFMPISGFQTPAVTIYQWAGLG